MRGHCWKPQLLDSQFAESKNFRGEKDRSRLKKRYLFLRPVVQGLSQVRRPLRPYFNKSRTKNFPHEVREAQKKKKRREDRDEKEAREKNGGGGSSLTFFGGKEGRGKGQ